MCDKDYQLSARTAPFHFILLSFGEIQQHDRETREKKMLRKEIQNVNKIRTRCDSGMKQNKTILHVYEYNLNDCIHRFFFIAFNLIGECL